MLTLLLAIQVAAAPVAHTGVWTDPIQTDPTYSVLPTGPYAMRVQPHNQPWTFYSIDNVHTFTDGMAWTAWFAPLAGYAPTMYRTDVIGYRTAWYLTRVFAERGPACSCWHNVQNTMWHLMGLSDVYDEELLRDATAWYAATGQYSDWRNAYVVTDVERTRMEYLTGTVIEWTPQPPTIDDPTTTVPEPNTWMMIAAGGLAMLAIRRP